MTRIADNNDDLNVQRVSEVIFKHERLIRSLIVNEVKDQALADDIYQDLFVTFLSKGIPDDVRDIRRYLCTIVRHDIIDAHRHIKCRKKRLHALEALTVEHDDDDPSSELERIEQWKIMFEYIEEHVPKKQAMAIRLRFEAGLDTNEIAERMGIKPRSVHWYICKGLERLRQQILGEGDNGGLSGNSPFPTPGPADP